jgi:RNA-directed DNA polymerase
VTSHRSARKHFSGGGKQLSHLDNLRSAVALEDLARLLGFVPSGLSFVLYKIPAERKYNSFKIPKRDGGTRQIKAPEPRLALLQRRLANLLYDCLDELGAASPPPWRSLAHGFERGRSIVTNASLHKRRRYVLNVDLEDFFPSINFGRVRGFFLKDRQFSLQPKIATLIAQISCHENQLPQGSPCSPVVSNLVGHLLDARLARLAKIHKCTYSRYADDITFSTNRKEFPPQLALPVEGGGGAWTLGMELKGTIERTGFRVNEKKTRMQFRGSRQITTGLMVNAKVNVRQEYWRAARHMCHALFNRGKYYKLVPAALKGGNPGDPPGKVEFESLNTLGGVLAHIYHVKDMADKRKAEKKKEEPTAVRKLYSDFLFYKNFVAGPAPIIVPEGKTDSIHLRCAIRRLPEFHPRLGKVVEDKFRTSVRFMNFSSTAHELLQIGHGASQLSVFVQTYRKRVAKFRHRPLAYPVIVLIDNDEGGRPLFGYIKGVTKQEISFETNAAFYYLGLNLYLVKTPEAETALHTSSIESFFDAATLATRLEGKGFDPHKEHEEPGKYGKIAFATRVIEPNVARIDFSGFRPLLSRLVAVLEHYEATKIAPKVAAKVGQHGRNSG